MSCVLASRSNLTGAHPATLLQRFHEMRQLELEIGEQRRGRARAGDLIEVERHRRHLVLEDRPRAQSRRRPVFTTIEPPGKPLPPSKPISCVSAMNTPCSPAISCASRSHRASGRWQARDAACIGCDATRRTRRDDRDQLRAVHCGNRSRQRVPRVLAYQHRRAPEASVECAHVASRLDEALFVEDAIRGKKYSSGGHGGCRRRPRRGQPRSPSCRDDPRNVRRIRDRLRLAGRRCARVALATPRRRARR